MVEFLTQQQLQRLRDLARAPRDHILIEVQYQTGCSVSELVEIKRTDIHIDHITINGRKCYVSEDILRLISKYLATHSGPYLFSTRQSQSLTSKRVQQIVKRYLKQLDQTIAKKTPHILRYTHIAHALRQNIPLRAIKKQTGLGELRLAQLVEELAPKDATHYGGMLP